MSQQLEQIKDAANRCLDGMTYNREKLARDALLLVEVIERQRERIAELTAQVNAQKAKPAAFGDAFDEIFGRRTA